MKRTRFDVPKSPDNCPHCGSSNFREQQYSDEIQFRALSLDVEMLLRDECLNCGETWVTEGQAAHNVALTKIAYETERDRLRERDGLLTGQQICDIRKTLNLNQRQAAAIFGGGSNAFNKYECGEVLQSFAMDRLLRLTHYVGDYAVFFLRDVEQRVAPGPTLLKIFDDAPAYRPPQEFVEQLLSGPVRASFNYEPESKDTRAHRTLTDIQPANIDSMFNMEFIQNDHHQFQ